MYVIISCCFFFTDCVNGLLDIYIKILLVFLVFLAFQWIVI